MPKITVVTVCYNAAKVIEGTILSVINQTYNNIEYIGVDGGSKDGTIDIIKKYDNYFSFWISEPDKGIYDAMNKAIKVANGEFINFMNAGDAYVDAYVLSNVSKFMNQKVGVVFGDMIICKNDRYYVEKAIDGAMDDVRSLYMGFNHQASFVRTSLAKSHLFDLRYRLAADFNMMRSLYLEGVVFKYCGLPVAVYDTTGVSSVHISKHRYDCLMIVNPSHPLLNKICAEFIGIKVKVKVMISEMLNMVSPSIMKKYYSRKKDYLEIANNNDNNEDSF